VTTTTTTNQTGQGEDICGTAHETYVINGSSILGKYARAAVAVDNEECSIVGRDILLKNGSTMDAAIAAALCNGYWWRNRDNLLFKVIESKFV